MFAIALLCAAVIGREALNLVGFALLLMVAYEYNLKVRGLPGNLAIAILTAVPFVFGALTTGHVGGTVLVLAALATLANLGREIVKDVEDMAGDVGRRTLPMRIGASKARRAAQASVAVGVALSPLPAFVAPPLGLAYLPLVAAADGVLLAGAFQREAGKAQRLLKLGMLVALVAFAIGRGTA